MTKATIAVVVAVAVIVFFDWVPTPLNRGEYARNVRILPGLGRSPIVPDVQHTLIHLAVLVACVLQWRAFVSGR